MVTGKLLSNNFEVTVLLDYTTFDVTGVTVPNSTTFDVTLMICLIRNMTSITQPINGFDSLPLPVETYPAADLATIRWYRNKLTHDDSKKISTADFNKRWSYISDVSVFHTYHCFYF